MSILVGFNFWCCPLTEQCLLNILPNWELNPCQLIEMGNCYLCAHEVTAFMSREPTPGPGPRLDPALTDTNTISHHKSSELFTQIKHKQAQPVFSKWYFSSPSSFFHLRWKFYFRETASASSLYFFKHFIWKNRLDVGPLVSTAASWPKGLGFECNAHHFKSF